VLLEDRGIWKKSIPVLNWILKISNEADNADITQLQARDTRHRRMQEVNSLCTDSGLLRANTVLCHSTQYSLLVGIASVYQLCYTQTWTRHCAMAQVPPPQAPASKDMIPLEWRP